MILSDKKGIQHIVMALAKSGLKEIVICPGSRNSPLVISFNRHPAFHCTSVRDERSAGFFALGKAIESNQPVALLCTSGSAALNFAPAIVEAYYQRIPLIVLTADRPKEWTNQGDGQTFNQTELYRNFIRKSFELNGDASTKKEFWMIERCISEGFNAATIADKGPVHFNIPVDEPLYRTAETADFIPKIFNKTPLENRLSEEKVEEMARQFIATAKVMILVGQHKPDKALGKVFTELSAFENTVLLTESISNIHHPSFIENIDRCITGLGANQAEELMPELLITTGGAIVSKRIKKLLRQFCPKSHWNVHPFDAEMDTYQSLTMALPLAPIPFFEQLLNSIKVIKQKPISGYQQEWQQLKLEKALLHQQFCNSIDFSDFSVFRKILNVLPIHYSVHLSNSSAIRYVQLFDNSTIAETWCNRGVSGIDGCTSTAMGAASAAPEKEFLLITGDIAFHYDLNALWNEQPVNNLKIIIINNSGGGIFRIIDDANETPERSQFLETTMQSNFKNIAAHYRWNYLSANDETSLMAALSVFFKDETPKTILEIHTDADKNPEVLKKYWQFLKEKSNSDFKN